jgi:hypothetical protein
MPHHINKTIAVPFLVVSDAVREEAAAALMKAGARDVLNKGDPSRIAPVVNRGG